MAIATGVSLEEYLHTEYEPDCDYVDGVLEERNVGLMGHGATQAAIASFLLFRRRQNFNVAIALRMQVSATRIRVPDVAVVSSDDHDQIQQKPPVLCIEVLSPDDRPGRVAKVIADYLSFGVPMIWIVDPYNREAFVVTQQDRSMQQVDELRWQDVVVQLNEIFPE